MRKALYSVLIALLLASLTLASCAPRKVVAASAVPQKVCFTLAEAREIRRAQIRRVAEIRRLKAEIRRLREALRSAKRPPVWPAVVLILLAGGAMATLTIKAVTTAKK